MTNNSRNESKASEDKKYFGDKQFFIALTFIIGFFTLLSISLIHYFLTNNLEAIKLVGTMFAGWVGAIIGFYFGQKPVEQVKQTLKEERERTKELTQYIKSQSDEMWKKLERRKGGQGG